jgi:uncharacterized protein (DUF433 family)
MVPTLGQTTALALPITIDPDILGGTPVFRGTRVPISTLFEYLRTNYTLEDFLECFPSVRREDAEALLTAAEQAILRQVQS